jgi:hypothetical protein
VTAAEATDLDLHPGLRDAWPRLMLGGSDIEVA